MVIVVIAQNWGVSKVNILGIKAEMPKAVLMILTFLLGVSVGVLLAYIRPWRKGKK